MLHASSIRPTLARHLEDYVLREQPEHIPRFVDPRLLTNSEEVVVVTGVRRCGKSTLVRQAIRRLADQRRLLYLNFEDPRLVSFEFSDFQNFFDEFLLLAPTDGPIYLVYDEIQLVESWERWVSSFSNHPRVRVIITGSNSRLLSSELSSFLTGRHRQIHLTPLSFAEILQFNQGATYSDSHLIHAPSAINARRKLFEEYMLYGGFPRSYLGKDLSILGQYYADIVSKDIALRHKIRNTAGLQALATLLAAQNGRLANKTNFSHAAGIKDQATVSRFIQYFMQTYLYDEVLPFSRSRARQLKQRPKYYCVDPVLAQSVGHSQTSNQYLVLENLVCSELLRRYGRCFYWHSRNGLEVDYIVTKGDDVTAIQVALDLNTPATIAREAKAIWAAAGELGVKEALVITGFPVPDGIESQISASAGIPVRVRPFYDWSLEDSDTGYSVRY
jgi:predicted AAA+ superfamily ATPase